MKPRLKWTAAVDYLMIPSPSGYKWTRSMALIISNLSTLDSKVDIFYKSCRCQLDVHRRTVFANWEDVAKMQAFGLNALQMMFL